MRASCARRPPSRTPATTSASSVGPRTPRRASATPSSAAPSRSSGCPSPAAGASWWRSSATRGGSPVGSGSASSAASRRLPGGIGELLLGVGVGLAAIPWSVVRLPFFLLDRALGRKAPPGGSLVDWLIRWRWATLGWANGAAAAAGPADVYHGHDLTGLPAAVRRAGAQRRPGRLRQPRDLPRVGHQRHTAALAQAVLRPAGAARGPLGPTGSSPSTRRSRANSARGSASADVTVVHNCPPRWTPPAELADQLRPAAGIPAGTPVALYHGGFSAHRGLEQLAAAILEPGMEDVHAAYLGYGGMRADLERMAADPRYGGRLHVVDAVPPDQLVAMGRRGGRRRHGAPAQHPEPLPLHAQQAVRVPGRRRAGRGVATSRTCAGSCIDDPDGPLGEVCDPGDPASIAGAIRRVLDAPDGRPARAPRPVPRRRPRPLELGARVGGARRAVRGPHRRQRPRMTRPSAGAPARHDRPPLDGRVRLADVPDRDGARGARPRGHGPRPHGARHCARRAPSCGLPDPAGGRDRRRRAAAPRGDPTTSREATARAGRSRRRHSGRGGAANRSEPGDRRRRRDRSPRPAGGSTSRGLGGVARRSRRVVGGIRRIAAMALDVRSQSRASRAVDAGADLVPRHGVHGDPGRPRARRAATRAHASCTTPATSTSTRATSPACPAQSGAVVGGAERRWARRADRVVTVNVPYAEVMARPLGAAAAGRRAQLLVPIPAAAAETAPLPRARSACRRIAASSSTRAGFSPDRGIEQLIEAVPQVPDATLVLLGYGLLRAAIDRAAAAPGMAGQGPRARRGAARPSCSTGWPPPTSWRCRSSRPRSTIASRRRTSCSRRWPRASRSSRPTCPGWRPSSGDGLRRPVRSARIPAAIAAAIREVLDAPDGGAVDGRARARGRPREVQLGDARWTSSSTSYYGRSPAGRGERGGTPASPRGPARRERCEPVLARPPRRAQPRGRRLGRGDRRGRRRAPPRRRSTTPGSASAATGRGGAGRAGTADAPQVARAAGPAPVWPAGRRPPSSSSSGRSTSAAGGPRSTRSCPPADLYHAFGILTIPVAAAASAAAPAAGAAPGGSSTTSST